MKPFTKFFADISMTNEKENHEFIQLGAVACGFSVLLRSGLISIFMHLYRKDHLCAVYEGILFAYWACE